MKQPDRQVISMVLLVVIWVSFAIFMTKIVSQINDGQKSIVCMLAIDIEDRQAEVQHCLEVGGLD